ncbi:hypothetical protein FS842_007041 [Serendipita sp. 407]|nr:hypothetical protein FS842_007041 [Serendipita sp. 407]
MDEDEDGDHEDGDGDEDEDVQPDEEIVLEDTSVQSFARHSKSVFAVAAHPTAPLAVSGGEDDVGYLWDTTTGEVILKLDGHEDSVVAVGFSHDGQMVATGGMDGRIRVWKQQQPNSWKNWEFLRQLDGVDEVVWLKWHPQGPVLLVGGQDATVWMYQLPSGTSMQVFASHTGPVNIGSFIPSGKRIITGDAEGTLIYWDPRSPSPLWKLSSTDERFGLTGGVISVAANKEGTIAVVGGAEGGVKVVSLVKEKGEVIGGLEGHAEGESVETVAFVDLGAAGGNREVVVTGGTDGKICVWDLNTMRLRTEMRHNDSVTNIIQHRSPSHVITTASADKTLKTWDVRNGTLLKEHTGHRGPINGIDIGTGAGGKSVIISAGDDGACLVWDTE